MGNVSRALGGPFKGSIGVLQGFRRVHKASFRT